MKIGVVGCGMVGSTAAFAMVMSGVGREVILVDLSRARAEAEAYGMDRTTSLLGLAESVLNVAVTRKLIVCLTRVPNPS